MLVHWIPGPIDLWRAINTNNLLELATGVVTDLDGLLWRYTDWAEGVQAGGAYQDDFVFLSLFGVVLWLLGGTTALLALSTRNGLIVGTPALWVLAMFLFYGRQSRLLILVGFCATLLLHVLLDQQRLERIWVRHRSDYSPMLLMDRMLSVGAAGTLLVLLAGFMPNVVIRPIAYRVYQTMDACLRFGRLSHGKDVSRLEGREKGHGPPRQWSAQPASCLKAALNWGAMK